MRLELFRLKSSATHIKTSAPHPLLVFHLAVPLPLEVRRSAALFGGLSARLAPTRSAASAPSAPGDHRDRWILGIGAAKHGDNMSMDKNCDFSPPAR